MRKLGEILLKGLEVTAMLIMPIMLIVFILGGFVYLLYCEYGWLGALIGIGIDALTIGFAMLMGYLAGKEENQ
jgi:hypothetical protein